MFGDDVNNIMYVDEENDSLLEILKELKGECFYRLLRDKHTEYYIFLNWL